MAIFTFALFVVILHVSFQHCSSLNTWALCHGPRDCRTEDNIKLHCASAHENNISVVLVRNDVQEGKIWINRQWILHSRAKQTHQNMFDAIENQVSRIGTEFGLQSNATCIVPPTRQFSMRQEQEVIFNDCRYRIRRERIRCRRPRGCRKNQPCSVPEDPVTSGCAIEEKRCRECCPGQECRRFPCFREMCGFTKTQKEFQDAMDHFRSRCPSCPDFQHHVVETDPSSAFFVYTSYDTTYVPRETCVGSVTAKHEVAHSLRYICNGSKGRYQSDAAMYRYVRTHSCTRKSSAQFSFNEGWAFFWAKDCDNKGSSENVAGDVANSLRSLQRKCSSSDSDMAKVLCNNPGKIYTLGDFKKYHRIMYGCS